MQVLLSQISQNSIMMRKLGTMPVLFFTAKEKNISHQKSAKNYLKNRSMSYGFD